MATQEKQAAQVAYEAWCAEMYREADWAALSSDEKNAWWAAVLAVLPPTTGKP